MKKSFLLSIAAVLILTGCVHNQPRVETVDTVKDSAALKAGELRIAESALHSGDIQVAHSLYTELSRNYPNNVDVWLGLGDTYFLDNQLEQAQAAYMRAEIINDLDAEPKLSLARIYIRMRDYDRAKDKLLSVIATNPSNPIALSGLGVVYDLTNQPKLAQETYRKGLQANPGDNALRSNLGLSLALNGKPREAVNVLLGHTGVSDNLPQARDNLALAYGLLGRDDAAEEILLGTQSGGQVQDNMEFYRYLRTKLKAKYGTN